MSYVKSIASHVGVRADKFYKMTLFQTDHLLLGLNCLEPDQVQAPHDHADQDKFYYVVEGEGRFWLASRPAPERRGAGADDAHDCRHPV